MDIQLGSVLKICDSKNIEQGRQLRIDVDMAAELERKEPEYVSKEWKGDLRGNFLREKQKAS